jgi:nucleoside phosphorylase
MFDAIFVPEGMEARAVSAAARRATSPPRVVPIGLGPERARKSVALALRASPIRRALVTGVCGLLAPRYKPAAALLYADVRDARRTPLQTDTELTLMLAASLPYAQSGTRALQWDRVVTTAHEKERLARSYEVDAVDMESYAVATLLRDADVRTAVLRIGSDAANDDLPDLNAAIGPDGTLRAPVLLREMLRSPRAGIGMAWNGFAAIRALRLAIALALG